MSRTNRSSLKWLLVILILASIPLLLMATNTGVFAQLQPQTTRPMPTQDPLAAKIFPTLAVQLRTDPKLQSDIAEVTRRVTPVALANETRGKPITVAGKVVQLPPEAYVQEMIAFADCVPPPECAETPAYVIVRGKSRVAVGLRTGRINGEILAPGEENAFAFLKAALR